MNNVLDAGTGGVSVPGLCMCGWPPLTARFFGVLPNFRAEQKSASCMDIRNGTWMAMCPDICEWGCQHMCQGMWTMPLCQGQLQGSAGSGIPFLSLLRSACT
jgi:hypothetical protein